MTMRWVAMKSGTQWTVMFSTNHSFCSTVSKILDADKLSFCVIADRYSVTKINEQMQSIASFDSSQNVLYIPWTLLFSLHSGIFFRTVEQTFHNLELGRDFRQRLNLVLFRNREEGQNGFMGNVFLNCTLHCNLPGCHY